MRSTFLLASSLVLLATSVPAVSAQNLVSNPGFETGDFTGWSPPGGAFNGVDGFNPHSGTYSAFFGEVGAPATISQSLATTPGAMYTLSFWLQNDLGIGVRTFEAYWGGSLVFSSINPEPFSYTQFMVPVVSTGSATELMFAFRHDQGFWEFDDVSVTASESTVPEPATMTLMATGLLALRAARKRRQTLT